MVATQHQSKKNQWHSATLTSVHEDRYIVRNTFEDCVTFACKLGTLFPIYRTALRNRFGRWPTRYSDQTLLPACLTIEPIA